MHNVQDKINTVTPCSTKNSAFPRLNYWNFLPWQVCLQRPAKCGKKSEAKLWREQLYQVRSLQRSRPRLPETLPEPTNSLPVIPIIPGLSLNVLFSIRTCWMTCCCFFKKAEHFFNTLFPMIWPLSRVGVFFIWLYSFVLLCHDWLHLQQHLHVAMVLVLSSSAVWLSMCCANEQSGPCCHWSDSPVEHTQSIPCVWHFL